MNINKDRNPPLDETCPASPEAPSESSGWIDCDRLVWDPEYRRQISDLLKRDETRRRKSGGTAGDIGRSGPSSGLAVGEISPNVLENC